MQIITTAVQKGGAGKTTTAAALIHAALKCGKRCLAVDLDPQGNFSFTLGANTGNTPGSYDLLTGKPAAKVIQSLTSYLDVIPSNWNLSTISSGKGSARRLQKALEPIKGSYDLIVIDTPPTAGELQYNALQASTGLIIPLKADIYNLQALYQIANTAKAFQESNKELQIKGFVLTQFNERNNISQQMKQTITERAAALNIPFLGAVRPSVSIVEAAAMQQSIFEYAPKSKPAADYMEIYNKII